MAPAASPSRKVPRDSFPETKWLGKVAGQGFYGELRLSITENEIVPVTYAHCHQFIIHQNPRAASKHPIIFRAITLVLPSPENLGGEMPFM